MVIPIMTAMINRGIIINKIAPDAPLIEVPPLDSFLRIFPAMSFLKRKNVF
jgi:hypothetical protein